MLTGFRIGIASGIGPWAVKDEQQSLSVAALLLRGATMPRDRGIGTGVRLPDFLGIGTQKGGTTYLHGLLQQHPQVFLAHPKELHYFSLHHQRGLDWYGRHFEAAAPDQRCGEVTPYYLFHPLAAERIAAALPDVKLIVLLRDPVERALSQYFHSKRLGLEPLELEAAFAAEAHRLADADADLKRGESHRSHQQHSYLSRSRYEQQLPCFEALFPSEQLQVLCSEDFFERPQQLWERVLAFLGLDEFPLPALGTRYAGLGEAASVSLDLRQQLRAQLELTYRWLEQR